MRRKQHNLAEMQLHLTSTQRGKSHGFTFEFDVAPSCFTELTGISSKNSKFNATRLPKYRTKPNIFFFRINHFDGNF